MGVLKTPRGRVPYARKIKRHAQPMANAPSEKAFGRKVPSMRVGGRPMIGGGTRIPWSHVTCVLSTVLLNSL